MLAQRYRHRVAIQARTEEQDSETGETSHTWASADLGIDATSVPAEVLTGPGREFQAASAKQAEADYRVTMPWFAGLLPTHRLVWDGQIMDIISIETDATARRQYRLRCKAGVNAGG